MRERGERKGRGGVEKELEGAETRRDEEVKGEESWEGGRGDKG